MLRQNIFFVEIIAPVSVEFSEKNIKNIEKKQTLNLKIKR